MNKVAYINLCIKLSDLINVHQCFNIKYGKHVHILPFDDSIQNLSSNIFDIYLKPYFFEGIYNKPVSKLLKVRLVTMHYLDIWNTNIRVIFSFSLCTVSLVTLVIYFGRAS